MSSVLVLNPLPKRRRKSAKKRVRRSARRVVRAANPAPRRHRRRRAVSTVARTVRRTLSNPRRASRRRRNPVSFRSMRAGLVPMLKSAAIGGAGALAVDFVMDKINGYLPASLQPDASAINVNDAIKVALTVAAGKALSRSTKGMSEKMAAGALTVQAYEIISALSAQFMSNSVAGRMGYNTPNRVIPGSARISPIASRMSGFLPAGSPSPLLARFTNAGPSPLLNRGDSIRSREGVTYR